MYQDNLKSSSIYDLLDYVPQEYACEKLDTGRNGLYKLLNTGELHAIRTGNTWKIPEYSIVEYKLRKLGINISIPTSLEDIFKPINQLFH